MYHSQVIDDQIIPDVILPTQFHVQRASHAQRRAA